MLIRPFIFALVTLMSIAVFAQPPQPPMPPNWRLGVGPVFGAGDLLRALAARLPGPVAELDCPSLSVHQASAGLLLVICGERQRLVEVGNRRRGDAARIIAIALIDLAADSLELLRLPTAPRWDDTPNAKTATVSFAAVRGESPVPTTELRLNARGTMGALISRGLGSNDVALPGLTAGLELGLRQFWVGVEAHYQRSQPNNERITPRIERTSVRLRTGVEHGHWRFSGNVELQRVNVSKTATYSRTFFAGGLSGGLRLPLSRGISFVVEAGIQGYARRVSIRFDDRPIATSPRVALRFASSLQWTFNAR